MADVVSSGSVQAGLDQPLYAVLVEDQGNEVVRYVTDENELDVLITQADIQLALSLPGTWSDLDWEETLRELDRIRHESTPTPPIEL